MNASGRLAPLGRTLLRLLAVVAVAWAALAALDWVKVASDAMPGPGGPLFFYGMIGLALLGYAVLLAIPFVPGIEIGIMILAMQGPGAALPVYLATLFGLALAFLAGAGVPARWLAATLADLGLARASGLVERAAPLDCDERVALLRAHLPAWLGRAASGLRYVILAAVLNVPGNWIVGGGGGIMLLAGLSGLFRPGATLLTVALAVAPVPLIVWGFGIELM